MEKQEVITADALWRDETARPAVSPRLWRGVAFALPVSLVLWWLIFEAVAAIWRAVT